MKRRIIAVATSILLLVFGYLLWRQPIASYVKPTEMTQEMKFLTSGLGVTGVVGEIKRPAEGRSMTFVVKERQSDTKEWVTHYVGKIYNDERWKPQAEKLAIFFDEESKLFHLFNTESAFSYELDLPTTSTKMSHSWGGGFPELKELPLEQFIPIMLCSVGTEPAVTIPDAADYKKWQTDGKVYDYVIGIEVSKETNKW